MYKKLLSSVFIMFFCLIAPGFAQTEEEQRGIDGSTEADEIQKEDKESEDKSIKTISLNKIVIKGEADKMKFPVVTEDKIQAGDPQSIMDVLKNQAAILDYKGESDLVTKDDQYYMRGYHSNRFTTAIDGMVIRKTGGRQASDIVDYGFIPPWLVEKTEIIPGPHSALFPAKSIGGVLNFVTKTPKLRDTLIPDIGLSASYRSYNTQNYNGNVSGNVSHIIYDAGYQYYSTDGYLRHTAQIVNTAFGRIGYAFDNGGFVTVSATDSRADRELSVENYPGVDADDNCPLAEATYDPDYPAVIASETDNLRNIFFDWQHPTWDRTSRAYRVNMNYPTPIGIFSGDGYKHKEVKTKDYISYSDEDGFTDKESETLYWSRGGRLQYEIGFSDDHKTTLAYDLEQLYDGEEKDKRVEIQGGALQHEWKIISPLTLTLGMRYEHVLVNVSNSVITGKGEWIERKWDGYIPKSILTYDMDDIADFFRDTTVIAAVSRIWHAPDYHGLYNPQGRPTGAWLKPEEGTGYDFIFSRRVFYDLYMKAGYSFMEIRNYFAYNSEFAEYTPSGSNPVEPGQEYKDYMINLHEMHRHGVELDLNGDVFEPLNISASYSYQKYINQGNEPAGEEAASDMAKHKFNAGARYKLLKNLVLIADYSYRAKQVATYYDEEEDEEGNTVYYVEKSAIPSYQLVNLGLSFAFIDHMFGIKNAAFKVFVNNVFDEEYENARGYKMTGRTYGCSLSARI